MKGTYHQSFGARNTQNIIITPSDPTQEGGLMVTIQFCDFVAVWFGAEKISNDIVGYIRQIGPGPLEEGESEIMGVCKFLKQLGYKKAAMTLKQKINEF